MSRQIVLDTETTGLDPKYGHKIIEIGCVELINRRLTGNNYHQYINPERPVDEGAFKVHGISDEFLADKPVFKSVYSAFFEFIKGAELIIHNAPFDIGFINAEFSQLESRHVPVQKYCAVIDTLVMAKKKHPGQRNNLDALCKRYKVDNSGRDLHGALLDAEILADVYLAMTSGQDSLDLNLATTTSKKQAQNTTSQQPWQGVVIKASAKELTAHQQQLQALSKKASKDIEW